MSRMMENIKTINSLARTLIILAILILLCAIGYFVYDRYIRPGLEASRLRQEISDLKVRFEAQSEELARVQTALKLLKVDNRKATIRILETGEDAESGEAFMTVEFTEVNTKGEAICDPRTFHLNGTTMFVDSWLVKFDDKYVEQAEELRATSLCLFKSIYGDGDGRRNGISLDRANNEENTAYGSSGGINDFERKIWSDFWSVANDRQKQESLGIRTAQGEIAYIKVQEGKTYHVDLRSSGGLNLRPLDDSDTVDVSTSNH